jgi:hypothetical protein
MADTEHWENASIQLAQMHMALIQSEKRKTITHPT